MKTNIVDCSFGRKIDGVNFIIIDSDRNILVQRRCSNAPTSPNLYCFPGGAIEEGETPYEAVKREIWEETGAFITDLKPLFDYEYTLRGGSKRNRFYLAYEDIDTGNCKEGKMYYLPLWELHTIPLALDEEIIIPHLSQHLVINTRCLALP